jgi:hypothetical protein
VTGGDDIHLPPLDPPPPSPALDAALRDLKPVATRRPSLAVMLVTLASLVWVAAILVFTPRRPDFAGLPMLPWLAVSLAWLGGFMLPLSSALVPPRGCVLPDSRRASWTALAAAIVLVGIALLLTPTAPATIIPSGPARAHLMMHCLSRGLAFASVPFVLALFALRRLMLVGAARLAATAGVAGAALGGLTLHVICPAGGAFHVGCGHAGAILIGALVGAALGFVAQRR